ncbi:hypothetical protein TMEN_9022 [Trichophyton mentagrophytes]|nr:hypothetical protein TMEN_9022 [Trichophyton mentagrophytes]
MSDDEILDLLRRFVQLVRSNPEPYLKAHLDSLSEDERRVIKKFSRILSESGKGSTRKGNTTVIEDIKDITTIQLSFSLEACLKDWKRDPKLFFKSAVDIQCSYGTAGEIFSRIRLDEDSRDTLMIRRRFDLRALYQFAVSQGLHTGKSWRNNGSQRFALVICNDLLRHGDKEVNAIMEKVRDYVYLGQGFHLWAEKLGGPGYLLIMPLELSETKYAHRNHHPRIKDGAAHLQTIGIQSIAERYQVLPIGDYISSHTLKHLKPTAIPAETDGAYLRPTEAESGSSRTQALSGVPAAANQHRKQGKHDKRAARSSTTARDTFVEATSCQELAKPQYPSDVVGSRIHHSNRNMGEGVRGMDSSWFEDHGARDADAADALSQLHSTRVLASSRAAEQDRGNKANKRPFLADKSSEYQVPQRMRLGEEGEGDGSIPTPWSREAESTSTRNPSGISRGSSYSATEGAEPRQQSSAENQPSQQEDGAQRPPRANNTTLSNTARAGTSFDLDPNFTIDPSSLDRLVPYQSPQRTIIQTNTNTNIADPFITGGVPYNYLDFEDFPQLGNLDFDLF